jgi:hypothetical protein
MSSAIRLARLLLLSASCCAALFASATVQRWTFQDVRYADVTNTSTGEVLGGGTAIGFFVYDTDTKLLTWNIFTSPGWAVCNDPEQGNVCYTEGLHWTKGNSHVFTGAAFFQLLRGDQNTFPLLDMFLHATSDPAVMSLDLRNSVEIISDSPDTYRHIVSGTARLTTAR